MYYKMIALIVSCLLNRSIVSAQYAIPQDSDTIPLIRLIVNPDEYHNKVVIIKGYYQNQFENSAVYCSKEYDANGLREYGVWLQSTNDSCKIVINEVEYDVNSLDRPSQRALFSKLKNKYVKLKGVFNKDWNGHMGAYSGSFEEIEFIYDSLSW